MIELADILWVAGLAAFVHMTGFYILSLIRRDASVVDIGWGLGFVLIAWVLQASITGESLGFWLVTVMVSIWGLRLGLHIFLRNVSYTEEDWRYQNMRRRWGSNFAWRSYLQIFLFQGLLMLVIAAPILKSAQYADSFTADVWLWLGSAIWLLGFYFEAVGDYQLKKFIAEKQRRKKPKKGPQIMKTGLWRFTRHPNYFGEVTQWWGLFITTLSLPGAGWVIVSPLMITFLLLNVSGITMLEKKYEGNKEFEKYKQKTNAFFPGKPKHV